MKEKFCILCYFIKIRWFSVFKHKDALRKHQKKLLAKQLDFVKQHSVFYREHPELQVIDKSVFMERFDDINTVGVKKEEALRIAIEGEQSRDFSKKLGGVTVGLSSGTSGHRGVFLVSEQERAFWAGMMLAKTLPKNHLFGVKIAFFMRADSALYETVQSKCIAFRFFDMQKDIKEHWRELQLFQPTMLVAPPSCLLHIAGYNTASQIQPLKVISVAEVLEEPDAEVIKAAFGVKTVHQIYQCTEGFLGVTCEYGTLHLNEDILQIEKEWLDEQRFIPVVTDLRRRAQPVIRYRLNDVLVKKRTPCQCGSPFLALEKIEGRQDDVFEFPGDTGTVSVFPDFIRRCILFADGVGEYRVQQISAREVRVLADGLCDRTKQQVRNEFEALAKQKQFAVPSIVFEPYRYDAGRKLKRVEKLC